jgi:hypothetical protein
MKLYPVPGGTWEGTEADWKKAMKAAGHDPKAFEATKTREVPTGKKELMEFLTFFAVDPYRTGRGVPATTVPAVDVEALRREHNPDAPDLPPAPPAPPAPESPAFADTGAEAQLSRIDNPGAGVDKMIDFISTTRGPTLKRFAGAVAMAFQNLTNG